MKPHVLMYDAERMREIAIEWIRSIQDLVRNAEHQPSRNRFEASLFETADAYKAVGLISLEEYAQIIQGEKL